MTSDPNTILTAAEIITRLDLKPHPEGGHYRETFRDTARTPQGRARSSLIYFLLIEGETSHWHRVDAAEAWHFYAGAPLELRTAADDRKTEVHRIGPNLLQGERPQHVVPAHYWQSAKSLGAWTLVGCSVAPGFEFSGFELAPPDWSFGGS
ncbi:MAG TPA: cupin domain-containing protein [Methylocella sp.]|nr:cupin domain-containing protein [Methylocella sp.]